MCTVQHIQGIFFITKFRMLFIIEALHILIDKSGFIIRDQVNSYVW